MGRYYGRTRATNKELKSISKGSSEILIFLDTNFLLAIGQMPRFNFSYEIDRIIPGSRLLIVLEPIFLELEKIRRTSNPKVQMEARMSIEFVEKVCQRWNSEYTHRNTDFILLYHGEKRKGIIATNDRKLKKLARKKGIKILFIRNRRFLELQ